MNGVDANDDDERHSFTISLNICFFYRFQWRKSYSNLKLELGAAFPNMAQPSIPISQIKIANINGTRFT